MTARLDRPALGTWIKLDSTTSVEIAADAGFDLVVIDLEHTLLDLALTRGMIAMARALGIAPLVRVPDHAPSTIQRVLDAGADGVLVPHVDTAEDAAAVVRACRFPPRGVRGAGSTGPAGRWGRLPRVDYLRRGDEVLCIPQIESARAVAEAGDIAAVAGVDAVFLGAADLALDTDRADVSDLLTAARSAARTAGTPCGSAAASATAASAGFDAGDAFVVCSNDTSMLAAAAHETVAAVRRPVTTLSAPTLPHPTGAMT